jgi:hypothetical protein
MVSIIRGTGALALVGIDGILDRGSPLTAALLDTFQAKPDAPAGSSSRHRGGFIGKGRVDGKRAGEGKGRKKRVSRAD